MDIQDNFKPLDTSQDKDYYMNMFDLLDLFDVNEDN